MGRNLGQILRFCKLKFLLKMLVFAICSSCESTWKEKKRKSLLFIELLCCTWASFFSLNFDSLNACLPQAPLIFHIVCAHFILHIYIYIYKDKLLEGSWVGKGHFGMWRVKGVLLSKMPITKGGKKKNFVGPHKLSNRSHNKHTQDCYE